MGRERKPGPRYANGNLKGPQKKYNRTQHGLELRVNAARLRRKLGLKVGDPRDAGHDKGSKTEGKPMSKKENRGDNKDRLKIRRTA